MDQKEMVLVEKDVLEKLIQTVEAMDQRLKEMDEYLYTDHEVIMALGDKAHVL